MLQNNAPCSIASSSATWVCGSEAAHQARFIRGFSTPSRYEEHYAFRLEVLLNLGYRSLVERK